MQTKDQAYNAAKKADRLVTRLEHNAIKHNTKYHWSLVTLAREESYRLWSIYDSMKG